jgi:UDP-3-O-[3-hydroxymyristoyl] glucosamine N-acyltransferase
MAPTSLGELARILGAELRGDPSIVISDVSEPEFAEPGEVALLTDPGRVEAGLTSRGSAFVVPRAVEGLAAAQLVCADPKRALGLLLQHFAGVDEEQATGVDQRAAVADGARVDRTAWVGPFCYVGESAVIGPGCRIEPFSYVGRGARVGRGCRLGPGATLAEGVELAEGVVVGPGAVVGYRGFGFWRDGEGWHPVPSRGGVTVGQGSEIGANSCVDAGTIGATRIGAGVKIDNLVQVGHNCQVEQRALLCAQVGLAGSVTLDKDCVLGGQVGVADHLSVGQASRVGAQSGIARDVPPRTDVSGYPAIPHTRWLRASAWFSKLDDLAKQVRQLARQVSELLERD